MVETVLCVHCGAQTKHPVTKTIDGRALNFCCGGCLQVYELLRDEGLQSGQSVPRTEMPGQPEPVHSVIPQRGETVTISIIGMTCSNCVAHVTRSLRSVPGVINVEVTLSTGLAKVEMIPGMSMMTDLKHAVEAAGYKVSHLGDA